MTWCKKTRGAFPKILLANFHWTLLVTTELATIVAFGKYLLTSIVLRAGASTKLPNCLNQQCYNTTADIQCLGAVTIAKKGPLSIILILAMCEAQLTQKSVSSSFLLVNAMNLRDGKSAWRNLSPSQENPAHIDSYLNDWSLPAKFHQTTVNVFGSFSFRIL